MKKIGVDAVAKVDKDISLFTGAAKRLKETFSQNQSNEFQAREKELLTSYYGNQKSKTGLVNLTSNVGEVFAKWRSAFVDDQTKNTSAVDQTKNDTTNAVPGVVAITSDTFAQWMFAGMSPILDQQRSDLALVNFSEVKDFSSYFDTLGRKLLGIKSVL